MKRSLQFISVLSFSVLLFILFTVVWRLLVGGESSNLPRREETSGREKSGSIQEDGAVGRSVRLVDAVTERFLTDRQVRITSGPTIFCFKSPCPDDSRELQAKTNLDGFLDLPSGWNDNWTFLAVEGYHVATFSDREIDSFGESSLELSPGSQKIFVSEEFSWVTSRRFKLLDSRTGKALGKVKVGLTGSSGCQPPQCRNFEYQGETNLRGYSYYPEYLFRGSVSGWVYVEGYHPQPLPLGGRYKLFLEKAR